MTSLLTSCHAEVLPHTAYCSDEAVTTSGVATTAVLVLTALGVLCTRRCFREDFPVAGGPTMMQGVTSTDTEPCFLSNFLYASCHSKRSGSVIMLNLYYSEYAMHYGGKALGNI